MKTYWVTSLSGSSISLNRNQTIFWRYTLHCDLTSQKMIHRAYKGRRNMSTEHSWALPDQFVTNGMRLTLMPECWCRLTLLTISENANAGLTFFQPSGILAFTRNGLYVSTASNGKVRVYFSFPQCEREGISLSTTTGCGREGVFISTINSGHEDVSLSTTSRVWTWGRRVSFSYSQKFKCKDVSLSTTSIVGERLYPLSQ